MRFQYCLNASTIKTTPILAQISAAGQAGYTGIELWHETMDRYLQQGGQLRDIRAAIQDCGLSVPTTIYLADWFDATEESYPAVLDECKRRMDQAAELGAPHIIASPARGIADYQIGARRYHELLEIGRSKGVLPAMECLGFVDQLNTIEDALQVMEMSGHTEATTVLDPFHIFRGGGSIESITKLSDRQIAVSHFNDTPASPSREQQHDHHRVMPGEGHLDLRRYLQLLEQVGYTRFLSLELFREELWHEDPKEVARLGLEKMKNTAES